MPELVIKSRPIRPGTKLVGLAAKKAAAIAAQEAADKEAGLIKKEPTTYINPAECPERIGIIFDDSGSMAGSIDIAIAGVEEFLRSCKPNQTAVAIYPMNRAQYNLSSNLPALAMLVKSVNATGSTPLCTTVDKAFAGSLTRCIVFSDGEPNGDQGLRTDIYKNTINTAKSKEIPVDTVFIGSEFDNSAINFMKTLASDTGGIFLHLDLSKSNFRTAFKYLSPGLRGMLADKSFVEKLESGGV